MSFYKVVKSEMIDDKCDALKCFHVSFQKKRFYACKGLSHWLRWGQYVLDVRPLREYLKLPEEPFELYSIYNKAIFQERIKQIIDKVGKCESFLRILYDVKKRENEKLYKLRMEKIKNGIEDDLPF